MIGSVCVCVDITIVVGRKYHPACSLFILVYLYTPKGQPCTDFIRAQSRAHLQCPRLQGLLYYQLAIARV